MITLGNGCTVSFVGVGQDSGTTELDPIREHLKELEIPGMPQVAMKALQQLRSEDVNTKLLERTLEGDMGLAANVVRIANSPLYRRRQDPYALPEALRMLGLHELRRIVLASSMKYVMYSEANRRRKEAELLWTRSLRIAIGARVIANALRTDGRADAFLSGLMLRMGEAIMLFNRPEKVRDLTGFLNSYTGGRYENSALTGHCIALLGVLLCERWGFPENVRTCLEFAEGVDEPTNYLGLIGSVSGARVMQRIAEGELTEEQVPGAIEMAASWLGCDGEQLLALQSEIESAFEEEKSFFLGA